MLESNWICIPFRTSLSSSPWWELPHLEFTLQKVSEGFSYEWSCFLHGRCGSCPPQGLGNPLWGRKSPPRQCGCSELRWLPCVRPRLWVPPAPHLPTMQFLDPEDLLEDEEDDIFGEGKPISLAGARLLYSSVGTFQVLCTKDLRIVEPDCWTGEDDCSEQGGRNGAQGKARTLQLNNCSKGFVFKGL